jgi:alkanesulfonate monooxygenase SsuD/methylene tetrahydromethanopterin reductase-like flavin-dependent oxidoreductase (luciferase family)
VYPSLSLKLCDSWDDDAVLGDRANGVWGDDAKVYPPAHAGRFYQVAGALNVPRAPQGYPLLVQAGSSDDGRDFAARYAEAVFTAHQSLADAQSFYAGLKQRALRHGRDPETVKSCPIIGATEAEAPALEAELDRLTGTPEQVADAITDRYDQGAADGFTAGQPQHRRPGRVVTAPRP